MIVSINWLKKFTEIDGSIDELATLIGSRLVEIEDVIDLGAKYEGVVIAKVVECARLEGSDHLNVTKIDDGGVAQGIERDENGLVQVVCGAPNVRAGLMVVWIAPGVTLPSTHNDPKPVVLEVRPLRGTISNGMLASPKELGIGDAHEGILEIDADAAPGTSFAEIYELNDHLLDIENKSLTHRPDTFGLIGFAREVAAIQGKQFDTPDWLKDFPSPLIEKTGDVETPRITIEDPDLSARYLAVVLSGADGQAQSPLEMQTYLSRVGVRPISAVVDVTNYLMMLTGQPLHAFDYDKLKALNNGEVDIRVRAGREGEKLLLLDGREIELVPGDIVIANGQRAVALAGAMGGAETEIDENTQNIILESATFNLYNLRNTQMRHGIFSEAITRFTKGQPSLLAEPVLAEAVRLLHKNADATRVSEIGEMVTSVGAVSPIELNAEQVNAVLGSKFTIADISETLRHVEFTTTPPDDKGFVSTVPPFWRADIHIIEDVIEEVGRLNGFDTIEPTLPSRDFTAVSLDSFDQLRARLRKILARAGANEILTYSFVHGDLLQKSGQKPEDSYRITNSISPDLQYYRQTLTPSLLNYVHPNIKNGFDTFALFELNKVHNKQSGLNDEEVPVEHDRAALVVADKKSPVGASYYAAKKILDYIASSLQRDFSYTTLDKDPGSSEAAPFEYRRSAIVTDKLSGEYIGIVGEYKKSVQKAFKLPEYAAGFEIDPRALDRVLTKASYSYRSISRYPSTERDICFQVGNEVAYQKIIDLVEGVLLTTDLETSVTPVDIYQAQGDSSKNVTIRIMITSHQKTLNGDEVSQLIATVTQKVTSEIAAKVI